MMKILLNDQQVQEADFESKEGKRLSGTRVHMFWRRR